MKTTLPYWTPCKHYKQCVGHCPYCQSEADVELVKAKVEALINKLQNEIRNRKARDENQDSL